MALTDAEAARQYQLAQARRLLRFCEGRTDTEVVEADFRAILDRYGKVVAEREDIEAVSRGDKEAWGMVDGRWKRVAMTRGD